MIFDARQLARGWLSVALASAKDDDRPALHRTVSIEGFPEGLRLVATDSYVLLRSWVPAIGREHDPEPDLDESPAMSAVAMDIHGRARNLLGHLLGLALADGAPLIEVRITLGVHDQETEAASFEGLEAEWVVLEHPDHERLKLRAYEGEYPNWRKVLSGFDRKRTDAIALNTEIIGRLSKLGKWHGDQPLLWRFGGQDRMALLEVASSEPHVEGAVMPVRWDFDRDAPMPEKPSAQDEELDA